MSLPLTFVDNCAEAIVLAGLKPGVEGEVFNVVDDELLTSRQFLKAYKKKVTAFPSGFLISSRTCCVFFGKNIPSGQKTSFPLPLIAAAALPNGRVITTRIRNLRNGWAGNRACRWSKQWTPFLLNSNRTEMMVR